MNYLDYWKLKKPLFNGDEAFFSFEQQKLLKRLTSYAIKGAKSCYIYAPPQAGKTTLAQHIYQSLDIHTYECIYLKASANLIQQESYPLDKILELFPQESVQNSALSLKNIGKQLEHEKKYLVALIDLSKSEYNSTDIEVLLKTIDYFAESISRACFFVFGEKKYIADIEIKNTQLEILQLPDWNQEDCQSYVRNRLLSRSIDIDVFPPHIIDAIQLHAGGNLAVMNETLEDCLIEAAIENEPAISQEIYFKVINNQLPQSHVESQTPSPPTTKYKAKKASQKGTPSKAIKLEDLFYDKKEKS